MNHDTATSLALGALAYILADDELRDRFISLTGMGSDEIRTRIEETDFLVSIFEFLISHEPDLLAFADHIQEKPQNIVRAWRSLGGGVGHEW